jgi:hypothetical protein
MKEQAPFEPPQNFSQIDSEGELSPSLDRTSGFNRYVDQGDNFHFRVSEFGIKGEKQPRQKQMVVQQLAALAIPVAPVFSKNVDGMKDYFSVDVHNHPEFDESKDRIDRVDNTFLKLIFDDTDHSHSHNHENGVFYDFNNSRISKITAQEARAWKGFLRILDNKPEELLRLKGKIKNFKQHIEGEDGLQFIRAVCEHAEYTEMSPEEIQSDLLERSNIFVEEIDKILG